MLQQICAGLGYHNRDLLGADIAKAHIQRHFSRYASRLSRLARVFDLDSDRLRQPIST
jgi:hypothetical protein